MSQRKACARALQYLTSYPDKYNDLPAILDVEPRRGVRKRRVYSLVVQYYDPRLGRNVELFFVNVGVDGAVTVVTDRRHEVAKQLTALGYDYPYRSAPTDRNTAVQLFGLMVGPQWKRPTYLNRIVAATGEHIGGIQIDYVAHVTMRNITQLVRIIIVGCSREAREAVKILKEHHTSAVVLVVRVDIAPSKILERLCVQLHGLVALIDSRRCA